MSSMNVRTSIVAAALMGALLPGCQLIVDFDRSRIPEAGVDAEVDEDGGVDAGRDAGQSMDAGVDAGEELDAGGDDAGGDDAGGSDGGGSDGGPLDGGPLDGGPLDGGPLDAGSDAGTDAGVADTGAPCPAYSVDDDLSGAVRQRLVITEVSPGTGGYVELYNNGATDLDLDTVAYYLVSGDDNVALATAGAGITIAPGGFATVDWPATFTDTDAGGELALYLDNADFTMGDGVMAFVCWGVNPHGVDSVAQFAENGGKWTEATICVDALTMGAVHRLTSTTGQDVADWDPDAAPSPLNCE